MSEDFLEGALDALAGEPSLQRVEFAFPTYVPRRMVTPLGVGSGLGALGLVVYLGVPLSTLGVVVPVGLVALGVALYASSPGPDEAPGAIALIEISHEGLSLNGRPLPGLHGFDVAADEVRLRWAGGERVVRTRLEPSVVRELQQALEALVRLEARRDGEVPSTLAALRARHDEQ